MNVSPCKTFDNPQHNQLLAFVDQLRRLIELSVSIDVPEAVMADVNQQIVKIADSLTEYSGKKCLPQYNMEALQEDPNSFLPYSPMSGRFNPLAPPVEYTQENHKLIGHVTCGEAYEGPPNCVHGAIVAAIYDQILAIANTLNSTMGFTASLNVTYIKPTPLRVPLVFKAWVEHQDQRKITLHGQCYANDELVSSCEALFITFKKA